MAGGLGLGGLRAIGAAAAAAAAVATTRSRVMCSAAAAVAAASHRAWATGVAAPAPCRRLALLPSGRGPTTAAAAAGGSRCGATGWATLPTAAAHHRTFLTLPWGRANEMKHAERRLLRFSPAIVYGVVADVAHYADFVPWVRAANVFLSRPGYMEAELVVGFQLFAERYTSRVTLVENTCVEAIARDATLFHHLRNYWGLSQGPTPDSCWVDFRIEFAFRNALYAQASRLFFDEVASNMVAAYEARCAVVQSGMAAAAAAAAATAPPPVALKPAVCAMTAVKAATAPAVVGGQERSLQPLRPTPAPQQPLLSTPPQVVRPPPRSLPPPPPSPPPSSQPQVARPPPSRVTPPPLPPYLSLW